MRARAIEEAALELRVGGQPSNRVPFNYSAPSITLVAECKLVDGECEAKQLNHEDLVTVAGWLRELDG